MCVPGSGLAAGKSHLLSIEEWRQEDWGCKVMARLGYLGPCFKNRKTQRNGKSVCLYGGLKFEPTSDCKSCYSEDTGSEVSVNEQ